MTSRIFSVFDNSVKQYGAIFESPMSAGAVRFMRDRILPSVVVEESDLDCFELHVIADIYRDDAKLTVVPLSSPSVVDISDMILKYRAKFNKPQE